VRPTPAGEQPVSKKRSAKNERYGFGGRKRLGKQNDVASAADTEGYRPGRFDDGIGRRCSVSRRFSPCDARGRGSWKPPSSSPGMGVLMGMSMRINFVVEV
jgi:hypothetical protein